MKSILEYSQIDGQMIKNLGSRLLSKLKIEEENVISDKEILRAGWGDLLGDEDGGKLS